MKDILLAIICALVASSGFWALMWKQIDKKDNKSKLLIGLGHDRIMALGIKYIERGYITTLINICISPIKRLVVMVLLRGLCKR